MGDSEERDVNLLPIDSNGLWRGCMLALSVHAVMLAEFPFILNEHIWMDGLYLTMNHEGAKGLVAFTKDNIPLAGLFRDFASERTALVLSDKYARSHFKEAPNQVRELSEAVFPFFKEDVGEEILPVVTTGFWWETDGIISRDSPDEWVEHGGHILEAQMMDFEAAMEYYENYYNMGEKRAGLAARIYHERIQQPEKDIILKPEELTVIRETGADNLEACREVFGSFGVFF